jgi:hypothetical protein
MKSQKINGSHDIQPIKRKLLKQRRNPENKKIELL